MPPSYKATLRYAAFSLLALALGGLAPLQAQETTPSSSSSSPAPNLAEGTSLKDDWQRWLRLQIFLDDADFNPGKIDGRWGEFTAQALNRYLQAQNREASFEGDTPPEQIDLPLPEDPLLVSYEIQPEDIDLIGTMASGPENLATQEDLPYTSPWEVVAERFHTSLTFLKELNPDKKSGSLSAGDQLQVPNIAQPFVFSAVRQQAEKDRTDSKKAKEDKQANASDNQTPDDAAQSSTANAGSDPSSSSVDQPSQRLLVLRDQRMLEFYENDKLIGCYPITPGGGSTPAPPGDWKITSITWLPVFRWDKSMLEKGVRSDEAYHLAPGPNNPVGIVWMALNKDGIGLHGTNHPDTIGRSSSHGCIRLANWDAWELGQKISEGIPVTIQ